LISWIVQHEIHTRTTTRVSTTIVEKEFALSKQTTTRLRHCLEQVQWVTLTFDLAFPSAIR